MPYRNMSLDQLARHIGIDAREVKRLADRGVLPGQFIGGQWRFNGQQMLEWLQREMHSLTPEQIRALESAMSNAGAADEIVGARLATAGIDLNLAARSKASVLRELVGLADRTGLVYDRNLIVGTLVEREEQGSTALPGGIAFPHPRRTLPEATGEPLLCLARVPAGIPFGAPDGRTTDLFVLVISHEEREHLRTLARLSQLFSTDLAERLRECGTSEEALALVVADEARLLADRTA
jgi:PTS system nitrogen regulatory IIA component